MAREVHGLGLVLLALLACGRGERQEVTPAPVVQAPAPAAVSAEAPQQTNYTAHAAWFRGDQLDACVDLAFTSKRIDEMLADGGPDAGGRDLSPGDVAASELRALVGGGKSVIERAIDETHGNGSSKRLRLTGERTPLDKECAVQFQGRTQVAGCLVTAMMKGDGAVALSASVATLYYDPTAKLDGHMKDCLALKGEWNELPVDSLERGHARRMKLLEQMRE